MKRQDVETINSEAIISRAEKFLDEFDETGEVWVAGDHRTKLNLKGKQIVDENENTEYIPRITQLIGEFDKYLKDSSLMEKSECLYWNVMDPPLARSDRITLKTIMGFRGYLIARSKNKEDENVAKTDILYLGFDYREEGRNFPWGLNLTEEEIKILLQNSDDKKYKQGLLWRFISFYEQAKKEYQEKVTSALGEDAPKSTIALISDLEGKRKLSQGENPVFKNGISLNQNLESQIRENKKKIFRLIYQFIKHPEREDGYKKMERATSGMTGIKVTMR